MVTINSEGCPCCDSCCDSPNVIDNPESCSMFPICNDDCDECFELGYQMTCLNCGRSCTCAS